MPPKAAAPKPLKHQPKSVQRRSKEEREAIDRAEGERRKARAEAAAADEAAEAARQRAKYGISDHQRKDGGPGDKYQGNPVTYRTGRGGRGGFMGKGSSSRDSGMRNRSGGGGGGGGSRSGPSYSGPSSSGAGASWVGGGAGGIGGTKSEIGGDRSYAGISTDTKPEPAEYIYISDEDGIGSMQDVDAIELSDDEDDEGAERRSRRYTIQVPRRLRRQEHRDRAMDMNTEAGTTGALTYTEGEGETDETAATRKKRKGKSKATIKPDPDAMEGVEEASTTAQAVEASEDEVEEATAGGAEEVGVPPESEDSKEAVAAALRKRPGTRRAGFQTIEQRKEAEREAAALATIQREFGSISMDVKPDLETMADDADNEADDMPARKAGALDNVAYLFQFPPIMPDLYAPRIKKDPDEPEELDSFEQPPNSDPTTGGRPVKIEDDDTGDGSAGGSSGLPAPKAGSSRKPFLEAGHVGKLRIHSSGKMTLSWGGTSFQAMPGMEVGFLQSVMLMRMNGEDTEKNPVWTEREQRESKSAAPSNGNGNGGGEKEESEPMRMTTRAQQLDRAGFAGSVASFGQVRGKLVVTPDWKEILG